MCVHIFLFFFDTQNYKLAMTGFMEDSPTHGKMRVVFMFNLYRISK